MFGYSLNSKGYKLWDAQSNSFVVSRGVAFEKNLWSSKSVAIEDDDANTHDVAIQEGEAKEEVNVDIDSQSTTSQGDDEEEGVEEDKDFHDANESHNRNCGGPLEYES